ncbi:mammalian ependymin-related protein 1-like [Gigantopelta aegis]|uniref:mammalian ependymin-related protein 1-like n=1 Tax=Gigantopelta aegis TaxID=1735272 RepID=UPI001B88B5D1|nr:mammalian ependymin-related protein 1-like [Gigantopelta aegis]
MILFVFGLILVVGGAFSQNPRRCNVPKQMEFRANKIDHREKTTTLYKQVVYDAVNKRIAWIEEDKSFSQKVDYHARIYLYNKNIVYDINISAQTCSKKPINKPFHEFHIPANATFVVDMAIGGPGEELFGQMWADAFPDQIEWFGVFSLKNCFPIRDHRFTKDTTKEASSIYFFDTVEGISHPDIFIPPALCNV